MPVGCLGWVLVRSYIKSNYKIFYILHQFNHINIIYLYIAIAGDVLLIMSLLILGGHFCERIRGLFIYEARIEFNTKQNV